MNRYTKLFTIISLFILISSMVQAIGVSPIRQVVDFEPNKEQNLELKIRNDDAKDLKAIIYARGELAQYIGITDSLVIMSKDEKEKIARYALKMPASFEQPGTHKTDMVVMEYPSNFATGEEATVSAVASVVSELWLRVPYPGKYAEAQLFAEVKGDDVNFVIAVMNFGKSDINKAKATIKILGATYDEIGRVETDEAGIKTGDQGKLIATWKSNVNPGKYHIVADISYDEKKISLEDNIEIGNLFIGIKSINVKDFSLGQVAVFDILLESKWNEPINNVYGEMTVLDDSGTEYTKFKTASVDMPAMGEGTIKAYWDTKGTKVGKYNLRLLIHYAEKVTEKLIETEVNIDSIRTELGPTAQVVAAKGMGRDTILTVIVILLVIINVGWFVYFIKSKKRK